MVFCVWLIASNFAYTFTPLLHSNEDYLVNTCERPHTSQHLFWVGNNPLLILVFIEARYRDTKSSRAVIRCPLSSLLEAQNRPSL